MVRMRIPSGCTGFAATFSIALVKLSKAHPVSFSLLMSFIIYLVGVGLLVHSAYSSYEFHHVVKQASIVPYDIILELVIGLAIILVGSINSIQSPGTLSVRPGDNTIHPNPILRPIQMHESVQLFNKLNITEYSELDNRIDFVDVAEKRKQYNDWISQLE